MVGRYVGMPDVALIYPIPTEILPSARVCIWNKSYIQISPPGSVFVCACVFDTQGRLPHL